MTDAGKANFSKEMEKNAHSLLQYADKESTSVDKLEQLASDFITQSKMCIAKHSRTYEVKLPARGIIFRDKRVKKQNKIRDRAQRAHRKKKTQTLCLVTRLGFGLSSVLSKRPPSSATHCHLIC